MTTTKKAWELVASDIVIPDSPGQLPRRVQGRPRLQGTPPIARVEFVGIADRVSYPAAEVLTVEVNQ